MFFHNLFKGFSFELISAFDLRIGDKNPWDDFYVAYFDGYAGILENTFIFCFGVESKIFI